MMLMHYWIGTKDTLLEADLDVLKRLSGVSM